MNVQIGEMELSRNQNGTFYIVANFANTRYENNGMRNLLHLQDVLYIYYQQATYEICSQVCVDIRLSPQSYGAYITVHN